MRDPNQLIPKESKQLFLYTGASGAAKDKGKELPPAYSSDNFLEIIPKIIGKPIGPEVANKFSGYVAQHKGEASTMSIHGRASSSTVPEFTAKAVNALKIKFPELTEDYLKDNFLILLEQTSTSHSLLWNMMIERPDLGAEMMKIAKSFELVSTTQALSTSSTEQNISTETPLSELAIRTSQELRTAIQSLRRDESPQNTSSTIRRI